tara:strand:+ start:713 stop:1762 length:1050 start_codon:yes stop_codon:yes gene_type:complete
MKLELLKKKFKGKKILITGNTGFVGSWLTILLNLLGAKILGYSLKKKDTRFLSNTRQFKKKIKIIYSDINNFDKNLNKIKKFKPQIVIHLASQPLVIDSYTNTKKTYFTNVMGTVNFFETIKKIKGISKVIVFTSDKVYRNLEGKILNEESNLGGIDPYSASKSCQDIISNSYKSCFLKKNVNLTILRAGNIIGGGDWNLYRLVPDIFKSIKNKKKIVIRNPNAVRPWQHILEILRAFILILLNKNSDNAEIFNIGPNLNSNVSVIKLIKLIKKTGNFKNLNVKIKKNLKYESKILRLSNLKAAKKINFKTNLNLKESVKLTIGWYKNYFLNKNLIFKYTQKQITDYFN